jgi:hypothetical protein
LDRPNELLSPDFKKPSYSRLLGDLNEREKEAQQSQDLVIDCNPNEHQSQTLKPHSNNGKPGGIIYELDEEENEQWQDSLQVKLPKILKKTM